MSNTTTNIPDEIKRFNWGAFFLSLVWSLYHRVWWGLLVVIFPVMPIILGFKGNEWAWEANSYESPKAFLKSQRKWGIAGLIIIFIPALALISTCSIAFNLGSKDVDKAMEVANNNPDLIAYFGKPIRKTHRLSKIEIKPNETYIKISAEGPKNTGEIEFFIKTTDGKWEVKNIILYTENDKIIEVTKPREI